MSSIMDAVADDARTRPGLRLGLPLAIAAALSFGMSGAWARGLIDAGWTPGAAVTVRIWVAALVLLIPAVAALRGRWRLLRRNVGIIAAYGLLAVTATQLFYFQAVAVMDVGLALLIEYTAPIAVVLWLWMRRGEKPTGRSVLGA
ncbi:EamA family transporter [Microbacterium sp. CH12i]|uniref:EamA family transporter n=1 Tax=Microbacterium sp. CH12i TaxID=1479651 RepID=UPI000B2143C9|nr:DMT family transporter [Microbacterium sp. CH12i]